MSARTRGEPAGGVADCGEVVARGRQPKERQATVGVSGAERVERASAARQRIGEVAGGDPLGADSLCARGFDRLD